MGDSRPTPRGGRAFRRLAAASCPLVITPCLLLAAVPAHARQAVPDTRTLAELRSSLQAQLDSVRGSARTCARRA